MGEHLDPGKQIFISYPHNDENLESAINLDDSYFEKTASKKLFKYSAMDIKSIIEEAISESGSDYEVWLDCDSIVAGSDFRKAIADGIAASSVVIMLVTSSYIARDTKKWCNIERYLTYIYRVPFIPISMEKGCILSDESVFSHNSQEFPISHLEVDDSFPDRLKDIIKAGIINGFDSSIYDFAESYHLQPSCLIKDDELVLNENNIQQMSTYVRRTDRISDIADKIQNLSDSCSMPLFICGESGSGKSELARGYADEFYIRNDDRENGRYLAEFEWDLTDEKVDYAALDFKGFCDLVSEKKNGEISSVFPFLNSKVLLVFHINDLIEDGIKNLGKLLGSGLCKADIIVTTFQNVDAKNNSYSLNNETDKYIVGEVLLKNFENNNGDRSVFDAGTLEKICKAVDFNMVAARLIGSHLGAVYTLGEEEFLKEADNISQTSGLEEKEAWVEDFRHNNISASFDDRILTVLKTVMFKNYNFLSNINDYDIDVLRYLSFFPGRWIEDIELKDALFPYNKSAFARIKLQLLPKLIKFGYLSQNGTSYQMHNLIAAFILQHLKETYADKMRESFASEICENIFCKAEPEDIASKRFIVTRLLGDLEAEADVISKSLFKMLYEACYSAVDSLYGSEEYNELALIKLEYKDGASLAFLDLTNLSEENNCGVTDIIKRGDLNGEPTLIRYIKLIPPKTERNYIFVQPDSVLGCRSSVIENRFANGRRHLEFVTFAEGLYEIGDSAFDSSTRLRGEIVLPDSLSVLGKRAFADTRITGIVFSKSLECIDNEAFVNCSKMKILSPFPDKLRTIGEKAFNNCRSIEKLELPDSVERIESNAFSFCRIRELKLPKNLKYLGAGAFSGNRLTGELAINKEKVVVESAVFFLCPDLKVIYLNDGDTDLTDRKRDELNDRRGKGREFKDYHFDDNGLYINDGIEEIPAYAFEYVTWNRENVRKEIYLPESLTVIGARAFIDNLAVEKVNCGQKLEVIENFAFSHCRKLKSIVLPQSLKTIGEGAFSFCAFESIELPEHLKCIGKEAFYWCEKLEGTIQLPSDLLEIGDSAFAHCNRTTVELALGRNIKKIGSKAFGCRWTPREKGEVILPKSLEFIGNQALYPIDDFVTFCFLNPNTMIGSCFIDSRNILIKGYPDSTAERYATENGLKFEYIS